MAGSSAAPDASERWRVRSITSGGMTPFGSAVERRLPGIGTHIIRRSRPSAGEVIRARARHGARARHNAYSWHRLEDQYCGLLIADRLRRHEQPLKFGYEERCAGPRPGHDL